MRRNVYQLGGLLLAPLLASGAHLGQLAESGFRSYIDTLESRLEAQHQDPARCFATLPAGSEPARRTTERDLLAGAIRVEPVEGGRQEMGRALLHHWRGSAFVPGAGPDDMRTVLRDYGNFARYYAPGVVSAKRVSGDTVVMRFRRRQVITVVLDAEFSTQSGLSGECSYRTSRSAHIWEVENSGSARERRLAEGDDDGFLWHLNSYWTFARRGRGLLIECEAVSLTRGIPVGLGWLISPLIDSVPRESLEFTLGATRRALLANLSGSPSHGH